MGKILFFCVPPVNGVLGWACLSCGKTLAVSGVSFSCQMSGQITQTSGGTVLAQISSLKTVLMATHTNLHLMFM